MNMAGLSSQTASYKAESENWPIEGNPAFQLPHDGFRTTNPAAIEVREPLPPRREFKLFDPQETTTRREARGSRNPFIDIPYTHHNDDFDFQLRNSGYRRKRNLNFSHTFDNIDFGNIPSDESVPLPDFSAPEYQAFHAQHSLGNQVVTLQPRPAVPRPPGPFGVVMALSMLGSGLETIGNHIHRNKRYFDFQVYENNENDLLAVAQMSLHVNPFRELASRFPSALPQSILRWRDPGDLDGFNINAPPDHHLDSVSRSFSHLFPEPPEMQRPAGLTDPRLTNEQILEANRRQYNYRRYDIHVSIDNRRAADKNLFYVVVPLTWEESSVESLHAHVRAGNFYLKQKVFRRDSVLLYDVEDKKYVRDLTHIFFGSHDLVLLGNDDIFLSGVNQSAASKAIRLLNPSQH